MSKLNHFREDGGAHMVDVSEKDVTRRVATATGRVSMLPATLQLISEGSAQKGDVLGVAQVAGIMAAKNTPSIIPMCHPLLLTGTDVTFALTDTTVEITATVRTTGKTGVEMEALTAVSAAALTIYDMVKAVDRGMVIENIQLETKSGGASGDWVRELPDAPVCQSDFCGIEPTGTSNEVNLQRLGTIGADETSLKDSN